MILIFFFYFYFLLLFRKVRNRIQHSEHHVAFRNLVTKINMKKKRKINMKMEIKNMIRIMKIEVKMKKQEIEMVGGTEMMMVGEEVIQK